MFWTFETREGASKTEQVQNKRGAGGGGGGGGGGVQILGILW